jgi:hypothetical protein
MFKFVEKFAELYNRLGIRFEKVNGILWREYQRMVIPIGPAILDYTILKDEAKFLLAKFPHALLVRWTDGFKIIDREVPDSSLMRIINNPEKDWYAVILTQFKDLEELSSNTRSKIRRGLKKCTVERVVDAKFILENGYDVFISAFKRYRRTRVPNLTREDFKRRILILNNFEDIVHFWGVFHKDRLIAYSENYIYDNIEVSYSTIKFDPNYLNLYPSYALFYTMNKYYLKESKFKYVNDGFRNILHRTNIQKFLIEKFNFRKEYTNLYVFYNPYLSIYLKITFPMRNFLRKICPKLEALYTMEEIKRKCAKTL